MQKRHLTIRYVVFYILFLPDSWQILAGLVTAYFLAPVFSLPDSATAASVMLYIMIATIGYAVFRKPANWFTRNLIKWILGENRP